MVDWTIKYSWVVIVLLLLFNGLDGQAILDCQARPQAFVSAHILLYSSNYQVAAWKLLQWVLKQDGQAESFTD